MMVNPSKREMKEGRLPQRDKERSWSGQDHVLTMFCYICFGDTLMTYLIPNERFVELRKNLNKLSSLTWF
jgi:hypothetical protein